MGLCASRFGTWPQNVRARVERTGVGVGAGSEQARGGKHGGGGRLTVTRYNSDEFSEQLCGLWSGSVTRYVWIRRAKLDKMTSAYAQNIGTFGSPRIIHPHTHLFFEDTPSGGPRCRSRKERQRKENTRRDSECAMPYYGTRGKAIAQSFIANTQCE